MRPRIGYGSRFHGVNALVLIYRTWEKLLLMYHTWRMNFNNFLLLCRHLGINFMWAHDKVLNITCYQWNGSVLQSNHSKFLLQIFVILNRIFKSSVTKTLHLQRNKDLSIAKNLLSLLEIIALCESWDVFIRRWWFSRFWWGSLSKARFTFAINWQRWAFTPCLVIGCCILLSLVHPPSRKSPKARAA